MKIVSIQECQIRDNPNYVEMKEGKHFVNLVFKTDHGNPFYIDISYTPVGTIKLQLFPIPHGNVKSYEKTIEVRIEDGATLIDKIREHD